MNPVKFGKLRAGLNRAIVMGNFGEPKPSRVKATLASAMALRGTLRRERMQVKAVRGAFMHQVDPRAKEIGDKLAEHYISLHVQRAQANRPGKPLSFKELSAEMKAANEHLNSLAPKGKGPSSALQHERHYLFTLPKEVQRLLPRSTN